MAESPSLRAFSVPWDAPLVPRPPLRYRDVHILTTFYRTDIAAVRALLPPPLEAASDTVAIHIYDMRDTDWFGPYRESAVHLDAVLPGGGARGAYAPYLFLDSDGALAVGREVYGHPKKFGLPTLDVRQDLVVGEIARNGITFVRCTTPYKQRRSTIGEAREYVDFATNINYRVLPDAVRQLTARTLTDVVEHECWRAPGTVELHPHAQAPVHTLPVRAMLESFHWRCDFTLPAPRVLHDYREPS